MDAFKRVSEIPLGKICYIDGLASTKSAVAQMKENHVQALIIKKRNDADANGIITVSDIISGVIVPKKTLEEVSVYEIMTKPVFSIPGHMNVKYAPRLMHRYNIRVAPVELNGEFIGMIDLSHLLFAEIDA